MNTFEVAAKFLQEVAWAYPPLSPGDLLVPGIRQLLHRGQCSHGEPILLIKVKQRGDSLEVIAAYHVRSVLIPIEWLEHDKYSNIKERVLTLQEDNPEQ